METWQDITEVVSGMLKGIQQIGLRIKRFSGHVSLREPTREHQGRPKGADAEGSEVGFEMDARKPTEGVAIATSREGDAAAAQKPRGAPAAGT